MIDADIRGKPTYEMRDFVVEHKLLVLKMLGSRGTSRVVVLLMRRPSIIFITLYSIFFFIIHLSLLFYRNLSQFTASY